MSKYVNKSDFEIPKSAFSKQKFTNPRNFVDPSAKFEAFKSRGNLFKNLEKDIIPKLATDFIPFAANSDAAHRITKFLGRSPVATN